LPTNCFSNDQEKHSPVSTCQQIAAAAAPYLLVVVEEYVEMANGYWKLGDG